MKNLFDCIYFDVVVPTRTKSLGSSQNFVNLLDEASGHSLVQFITYKSETADAVEDTIGELHCMHNSNMRIGSTTPIQTVQGLRSDFGE